MVSPLSARSWICSRNGASREPASAGSAGSGFARAMHLLAQHAPHHLARHVHALDDSPRTVRQPAQAQISFLVSGGTSFFFFWGGMAAT